MLVYSQQQAVQVSYSQEQEHFLKVLKVIPKMKLKLQQESKS